MDIKTSDNSEILVDLNGKPVGKYGMRKCIAKITNENGHITYSVREYAPRPMLYGKPEYYVPARGVNLTEENIKSICITLREELYNNRHAKERMEEFERKYAELDTEPFCVTMEEEEESNSDDDSEEELEDIDPTPEEIAEMQKVLREEEKKEWESMDPCMDEDYESELDMVSLGMPDLVFNDNNEKIHLSISSWYDKPYMFDLRVWTHKVNSRGFIEVVPELDKGLQLDDFEAEMLCQGVESLFPEILEETEKYKEENWQDKSNMIQLNYTQDEMQDLADAVEDNLNRDLRENLVQGCYGVQIGGNEHHAEFTQMMDLKGRLERNEQITDKQCNLLCNVLYEEYEKAEKPEKCNFYGDVFAKLVDFLNERGTNSGSQSDLRETKKLSASKGECLTASAVLNRLYEALYEEELTEEKQVLIDYINDLVVQDVKRRNDNFSQVKEGFEELAGQRFLLNLANEFYTGASL